MTSIPRVATSMCWSNSRQTASNNFSNFLDLKEALEELLQRWFDLVEPRAIRKRRLRYYIDQSKSPIYAAA
jgi:predicted nucleotidyltransferase